MSESTAKRGMAKVTCGANTQDGFFAAMTVAQVRDQLRQVMNIDAESVALVNGDQVVEGHIINPGDEVEFVKRAGEKG